MSREQSRAMTQELEGADLVDVRDADAARVAKAIMAESLLDWLARGGDQGREAIEASEL